jgi:uncharacterized protein
MKIVIAGGSGFLGQAISSAFSREGHQVVILTRSASGASATPRVRLVQWTPDGGIGSWTSEIDGADAIVNLSGESIAARRWSEAQKQRIEDTRVSATHSLVEAVHAAKSPPSTFMSGSAVGYYGPHGDDAVTEQTPAGDDFLARVCVQWEGEAERASSNRVRVIALRTGLVLNKAGGALPRMLLPFKLFAGGPVGSGKQYWPWIHLDDWVELVRWAIATPALSGAVNATAPNPVTNTEFARHLGRALARPAFMPAPGFALRLALGEMADALLLSGQRALPAKALGLKFTFRYPHLPDALRAIFNSSR